MQALRTLLPALAVVSTVCALALVPGCAEDEPRCECSVAELEFPRARSVEDTVRATFTVRNTGDGDRLAWRIENRADLGLRILENPLYSLDAGAAIEYTLEFAPQSALPDQDVDLRVGLDDCVIRVSVAADSTRDIGACCLPDEVCFDNVFVGDCETAVENGGLGGVFRGTSSLCSEAPCIGACCLFSGDCVDSTFALTCEDELDGTYQGDGTLCADVFCAPPLPICATTTDSLRFEATLDDLISGNNRKVERFGVTNLGAPGSTLDGRLALASCSNASFALVDSLPGTNRFSVGAGDTVFVDVTLNAASEWACDLQILSNAVGDSACAPVSVSGSLDLTAATERGALDR